MKSNKFLPKQSMLPRLKGTKAFGSRFFIFSGRNLSGLILYGASQYCGSRCSSCIGMTNEVPAGRVIFPRKIKFFGLIAPFYPILKIINIYIHM